MLFRLLLCGSVAITLFAQDKYQKPSAFNYRRDVSRVVKDKADSGPTVAVAKEGSASRAKQPAPVLTDSELTGLATFYGQTDDGRKTSNGDTFDNGKLTAAHSSLPFGTRVRVTHAVSGRSVVVTVTDRGRFSGGRIISVSRRAAEELGFVSAGTARVRLEVLKDEDVANAR